MIHGQTSENIHYWTGTSFTPTYLIDLQFVDYESITSHPLKSFKSWDDAINWLFLNGFKQSARDLNKAVN